MTTTRSLASHQSLGEQLGPEIVPHLRKINRPQRPAMTMLALTLLSQIIQILDQMQIGGKTDQRKLVADVGESLRLMSVRRSVLGLAIQMRKRYAPPEPTVEVPNQSIIVKAMMGSFLPRMRKSREKLAVKTT